MRFNLQFEPINSSHVDGATELVRAAYQEECVQVPFLPKEDELTETVRKSIASLVEQGRGVVALNQGEVVGFIAGWEIPKLWGPQKGIYSPVFGHGAIKEQRTQIYQEMYQHIADLWVKDAIFTHALTFFAHDQATIDTWFWLGFGLRCVDAMREVAPLEGRQADLTVRKAEQADIPGMAHLSAELTQHLNQTPLFMNKVNDDPVKNSTEWLARDNHHMWVAYQNEEPVGYMKIEPVGETYISAHPDVMNITAAYVSEEAQGSNIGGTLLNAIQEWLQQNGYPLCGVDFESFNISGGHFWMKHFTPYTHSMVRRIDERIV